MDKTKIAKFIKKQKVAFICSVDENGFPMMYVFRNCRSFIRTVPTLIFDENKVEDLNTEGEDHIADETRYFCMSRPIKPRRAAEPDKYYESPLYTALDIPKEDILPKKEFQRMEVKGRGDI